MTSRARSHILEEASRAYLRTLIPGSWAIHDYTHDYGVDVQVELFGESGERTGIRFYGQLKATDKSSDEDLLRLDRSHIEYWLAHTDPVALFRYYDQTKTIKWCWLDEIAWRINPGSQSLEVSRYLRDWNPETSQSEIEQFLHARRQALFQPLVPPFTISIEWIGDGRDQSPELVASIAKRINSRSYKIFTKTSLATHFSMQIGYQQIACSYLGLPGFVFHQTEESDIDDLSSSALLALFFCACRYERVLFARALATATVPEMFRAASEEIRPLFYDALIFAVGVRPAVEMLMPLLDDSPDGWLLFGIVGTKASFRYGESRSWIEVLRTWADVPPIPENAGAFAYNLANALMNEGSWDEANEAYRHVLVAAPEYANRGYFWQSVGASNLSAATI